MSSSPLLWDAVRATGVLAYLLLTFGVLVGVALAGKVKLTHWPRFAVEDVHRFLGSLVWVFLSLHVLTTVLDSYVGFSLADLVVPFSSPYKRVGIGFGVAATELLLALAVANRLRTRLSYRFWRRTHYLNFAVWAGSTAHAIVTGTDHLRLLYVLSVSAVAGAVGLRLGGAGKATGKRPRRPNGRPYPRDDQRQAEPRAASAS